MFVFGKKYGFLVMLAPEPLLNCSKRLQNTLFESSTLKIWYGALPVTTQAPKTLFWAKKWLFLAIFGQKCVFCGNGGPETLDYLLQTLQNTFF